MRKTKADPLGLSLAGQQPRHNPTVPLELGVEYGWLTPLRQSAGDKRFMVMKCRCGSEVIRRSAKIRDALRAGSIPCCPKCRADSMREAKERRTA